MSKELLGRPAAVHLGEIVQGTNGYVGDRTDFASGNRCPTLLATVSDVRRYVHEKADEWLDRYLGQAEGRAS